MGISSVDELWTFIIGLPYIIMFLYKILNDKYKNSIYILIDLCHISLLINCIYFGITILYQLYFIKDIM